MKTNNKLVETTKKWEATFFDIRGWENRWNWKASENSEEILYQTRFPEKGFADVYRGSGNFAKLLTTIKTAKHDWNAVISLVDSSRTGDNTAQEPEIIVMENIPGPMSNRWPVKLKALHNLEFHWEYEHPVEGNRDLRLEDPITEEEYAHANDNYLSFHENVPQTAIEELVISGTAAQVLLASLSHNDMSIAVEGPAGAGQWKYQVPRWWENEEPEVEDEEELQRLENQMMGITND